MTEFRIKDETQHETCRRVFENHMFGHVGDNFLSPIHMHTGAGETVELLTRGRTLNVL